MLLHVDEFVLDGGRLLLLELLDALPVVQLGILLLLLEVLDELALGQRLGGLGPKLLLHSCKFIL